MISTTSTTSSPDGAGRRRFAAGLLVALPLAMASAPAVRAEAPTPGTEAARTVVEQTVRDVLEVLGTPDLTTETRIERLEAIAIERFDFDTIARLVLARHWRRFTPDQRERFVLEFKDYLAESYGGRIERYEQESVAYLGDRIEPRGDVTVRTRIAGGEADGVAVDYRLREDDGGVWRVIDVKIEGISLVSSFRSQFAEVISRHGPEGLLQRLGDKNLGSPPELAPQAEAG